MLGPISHALTDLAFAAELGLSVVNTPTGVIFLAADVVDLIDEGHTGQAGLVAAVGAVFSAPTLKLLKITGKNATLRLSGRDYVISATLRDGIIEASTKATRY